MVTEREPITVLHAEAMIAHQELGSTEADVLAQVRERMGRGLSDELVKVLFEAKGGLFLSPITFTIYDDDDLGYTKVGATVNAIRLPDPLNQEFKLYGGRMHGRIIRVGDPAPEYYLIPLMVPVQVYYEPGYSGHSLVLEYRRVPGTQAYEFVREDRMPA